MTRQRKEQIKKRIAARNSRIVNAGETPVIREESEFEKKKHADAIAFLKKNGLPKRLQGTIDLDSL